MRVLVFAMLITLKAGLDQRSLAPHVLLDYTRMLVQRTVTRYQLHLRL